MAGNRRQDEKVQILVVDRDQLGIGGLICALPPEVETVVSGSVVLRSGIAIGTRPASTLRQCKTVTWEGEKSSRDASEVPPLNVVAMPILDAPLSNVS